MKSLCVTNLTMNSNLAIYIGAYTEIIHKLAILATTTEHSILYVVPYLKQMHIKYRIYSDEKTFMEDVDCFQPDALLSASEEFDLYAVLDKIAQKLAIDIISVNPNEIMSFEILQKNWYSVTIYNPQLLQTTYIYHTNINKNVEPLLMLNHYPTIKVEWQ